MDRQRRLRVGEHARIADRVGTTSPAPDAPFVDTTNLVEMLEAAAPGPDDDHWVYTPAERVRILQSLLVSDGSAWVARFGFLMAMSVLIATLGLASDQPAAVIAAMVVAPMMTPVLGIAAALTLGLVRQVLRLSLIVVVASLLAVAFGWLISASLVVHELTGEELSRTTPRLRDLVIALAAGAAGMYSVVRKDLSGVVPGVAIAVALVPPLATIGIVLELHEWSLARGAALLYGVNVLAIILASVVVLLVTDFMQSPPFRDLKVIAVATALALISIAVVIPVVQNSRRIDADVTFARNAEIAVREWRDRHTLHRIVGERVDPGRVTLVIAGLTEPDGLAELKASIGTDGFPTPTLEVDWVRSSIIEVDGGAAGG